MVGVRPVEARTRFDWSLSNRFACHAVVRITSTQYFVEACGRLRLASTIGSPPWLGLGRPRCSRRFDRPLQIIRSQLALLTNSPRGDAIVCLFVCSRRVAVCSASGRWGCRGAKIGALLGRRGAAQILWDFDGYVSDQLPEKILNPR